MTGVSSKITMGDDPYNATLTAWIATADKPLDDVLNDLVEALATAGYDPHMIKVETRS